MIRKYKITNTALQRLNIESERSLPYKSPLYSDFMNECKRYAVINTSARGGSVFPIRGSVSVFVEYESAMSKNPSGLIKPVLDAMAGVVYSDDSSIASLHVRRTQSTSEVDRVTVIVYNGIQLSQDYNADPMRDYIILEYSFETIIEDNPLPFGVPPIKCYTSLVKEGELVKVDADRLGFELFGLKTTIPVLRQPRCISIDFNTSIPRTDTDNVAAIVMTALESKYKRIADTREIFIRSDGNIDPESISIMVKT